MNAKNLIGGFIAGAALGVAAGLLLAPASGEKTMKKIAKGGSKLMKSGNKLKSNVVGYVDESIDTLRDQFNEKIDQLTRRGKEAINHASEKVKM